MLPSVPITMPRSSSGATPASAAIPTMERRDRSSLGRLVMPGSAPAAASGQRAAGSDMSVGAEVRRSSADTVQASSRSNQTDAANAELAVRAGGAASSKKSLMRATDNKRAVGLATVGVVKRTSMTQRARLALKRKRIDQAVKLVMSEPVVRTKNRGSMPAR